MLLRQKREVGKFKFVHPQSKDHVTAMQARAAELQDVYMPKDKRLEKKIEA